MLLFSMIERTSGPQDVDPRGPVAGRAKVAPGHVEAIDLRFDPQTIPARPGKARWIGLDPARFPGEPPVAALFRREIDLPDAPRTARVWFSADAHARIYVNGRLAARGPDDGGQDYPGTQTGRWFVDYRELSACFHRGKNVVSAEVFTARAMEGRTNTTGTCGLLFEAALGMPDGRTLSLASDGSWRGVPAKEWRFAAWKPREEALQFDATVESVGWRSPGFDDAGWPVCKPAPGDWPRLETSEIPPRLEAIYPWRAVQRPTTNVVPHGRRIVFTGDGSCAIRFDRVLSGFVSLKVRGRAGALLALQMNEPNEPGFNRMATIRLRDGEQTVELPFYDSFSVVNLVASGVQAPLEILDVRANFVAQPVRYQGAFACSDERLNRIWETSRWLTQICQQTHHLDSPDHQEPICDPGDYLVISLNNYCAFGQPYLARQDLRKYAWLLQATKYRPFHTSYALLWLQMLMAYVDYTGDTALARELAPEVYALLDQFASYRGKNGLLSEAPNYMFMDWVTIGGFPAHHPPAVVGQGYLTAFFYRALADGVRVAVQAGDPARAARYGAMREEIRQAYERELWDGAAGLYRDGKPFATSVAPGEWLPADKAIETHSAQNNALAVLYDLAPKGRQAGIVRRLLSADLNAQPYFMHFILDAVDHAGLFDEFGTAQMRRWNVVEATQTFREMWDAGDYSHAWQCTPLYQMSSRVLGIAPTTPGFDTFRIRPRPCDLTWARGAMPTPHGKIEANWTRSPKEFRLKVQIPHGTVATLELPNLGPNATQILDGKPVPSGAPVKVNNGPHEAVLRL